jgi:predicted acetyltransferase
VRTSARAGGAQDVAAAQAAYETVARTADGLLHLFAPRVDPLEGADGLSIVEDGDQVVAWALWRREGGYGHDGVLDLHDVVAATPAGADGLVALLHGWSSVAPTLRLRTLPGCALATRLPLERARVHEREAWMHRPVDLVRLVRDRGWAPHLRASLVLRVADPVAPWNTGTWSLEVADGRGDAHRTDALPAATLGPRGLALLLCGTTRADALALAGLLDVAPGHEPSELDVLQPAGRAQVLDSF